MKPLLAELHAHTTWSDGELSLTALVDLYGEKRFDVLSVTDHTVRRDEGTRFVGVHNWRAYLDSVHAEAARAARRYGLLVIPGLELTDDHADPLRAAHALAIGLRSFASMELGLRAAVADARRAGAATSPRIRTRRVRTRVARVAGGTSATLRSFVPTATSSSIAATSSAGSPSGACRASLRVTSTARLISGRGRRFCPALATSRPSWRSFARTSGRTSCRSRLPPHLPPSASRLSKRFHQAHESTAVRLFPHAVEESGCTGEVRSLGRDL